jgi:hypothetical protein
MLMSFILCVTSDGESRGAERIGDIWYTLDTFLRTAQLLHFVAASLDAHWQVSRPLYTCAYLRLPVLAAAGLAM